LLPLDRLRIFEDETLSDGLRENWDYAPSRPPLWYQKVRFKAIFRKRRRPPRFEAIKPISGGGDAWTLWFIYLPDGNLGESHRFTIERLLKLDRRLLIVCATPNPYDVPAEVVCRADAVYWKALEGFDFSAYGLGLRALADSAPHANVLVINDSVYGPFGDLSVLLERAQWDLTGFTASPQFENHIQSYAFLIRDVTRRRLRELGQIFPRAFSYDDIFTVVACLETRFARLASRHMTVGAFWYGPDDGTDPSVSHALELFARGMPFLKRSLLGKHREKVDQQAVRDTLSQLGHPLPAIS
jgi:hypothetical protein